MIAFLGWTDLGELELMPYKGKLPRLSVALCSCITMHDVVVPSLTINVFFTYLEVVGTVLWSHRGLKNPSANKNHGGMTRNLCKPTEQLFFSSQQLRLLSYSHTVLWMLRWSQHRMSQCLDPVLMLFDRDAIITQGFWCVRVMSYGWLWQMQWGEARASKTSKERTVMQHG